MKKKYERNLILFNNNNNMIHTGELIRYLIQFKCA